MRRTSCPSSSHQTASTWGMMLARLACMSRPYSERVGPRATRSTIAIRSLLMRCPREPAAFHGGGRRGKTSGPRASYPAVPMLFQLQTFGPRFALATRLAVRARLSGRARAVAVVRRRQAGLHLVGRARGLLGRILGQLIETPLDGALELRIVSGHHV